MNWGMSHDEVMASESAEPRVAMAGVVMYDIEFHRRQMILQYHFAEEDDSIFCVGATIQNHFNERLFYVNVQPDSGPISQSDDAIEDYGRWKDILRQELGEPCQEDVAYRDEELIEQLQKPMPIPEGASEFLPPDFFEPKHSEAELLALMRKTHWVSDRTYTSLLLSPGPFGGAMLIIRYISREHERFFPGHPDYKDR